MPEQAITSVAILKVNWDEGRDYIENFVPFVAECLRKAAQDEISLPELQKAIREEFALRIPQGALKTILRRATRKGYVRKEHGIYKRNKVAVGSSDLSKTRQDALRKQEALVLKLIEFCNAQYKINWSVEIAEAALLSYLQERSTPILVAALEGQPLPLPVRAVKHAEFLVNAFIASLYRKDPEGFECLETMVKGSMLANVLLLPDLDGVAQRFDGVEVYFDTNFLLRAMGTAGETMRVVCRELVDLLYEENAKLRCFDHTFEEVKGVLHGASRDLARPESLGHVHGETCEYFVQQGYTSSDVELMIARLDKHLESLHVRVVPRPVHVDELGVNETRLQEVLKERVHYRRQDTLEHDLDSITAIHRLRKGCFPSRLELCEAIFVTTNTYLAEAATRFFRSEEGNAVLASVPHCVADHIFTTLVWLKKSSQLPDLPRKRIIADCYAALNPPDTLWRKYLDEIDRLKRSGDLTDEDYNMLRLSMEARNALMDATLGDGDIFSEGTIHEVLEKAKASVRRITELALQEEKQRRIGAERRSVEADNQKLAYRQAHAERIRYVSARCAYWMARVLLVVLILGLTGISYVTLPEPFPNLPGEWRQLIAPVATGITAVLALIGAVWGTTLIGVMKMCEVWLVRRLETALARAFDPLS